MKKADDFAILVPSLYVRVYRFFPDVSGASSGSLIICEGISSEKSICPGRLSFPHYM